MDSSISEGFLGSTFHKFEPGSIVSSGNLFYEPEVTLSSDDADIFSYNSTSAYMENSIQISELNLTGKVCLLFAIRLNNIFFLSNVLMEFFVDNLFNENILDVNECLDENWNDCSPYANCTNVPGKYNCTCFPGYLDISEDPLKPGRLCAGMCA